jgi:hypothetical protein
MTQISPFFEDHMAREAGDRGIDSKRTLNIVLHDMEETLQYIAQFSKYLSGQSNIFIFPLSKK